jgi:hypothetical protein
VLNVVGLLAFAASRSEADEHSRSVHFVLVVDYLLVEEPPVGLKTAVADFGLPKRRRPLLIDVW